MATTPNPAENQASAIGTSISKFEGQAIQYSVFNMPEGKVGEIKFDLKEDSVNKFNAITIRELGQAVQKLKADVTTESLKGLLITSQKDVFIVGADITEFVGLFKKSSAEIKSWLVDVNKVFSEIEDLSIPSVVAINGFCLGGGMELALSAQYRVMSQSTKIGLPETKLGIFPGWGGTVRLPRLVGADNAIEWIAGGEQYDAISALKMGAVDSVVEPGKLREGAIQLLANAIRGNLDWKARQESKKSPLKLNPIESTMVFEGSKAFVAAKAGPNYPAPVAAIEVMQKGANKGRDEALVFEGEAFATIAKSTAAESLVGIFLGDQFLKKVAKKISKTGRPVRQAAVLGAGIMGGGVAYQSASKKIPIIMKDIQPKALELGFGEAVKLLDKAVAKGKMNAIQMGETLSRINGTLNYGDFKNVDLVVEAVVENEKIKASVLAEAEAAVGPEAILASNTSTISITKLSETLKRPENFCGMHFFNPVHRMPLVEVIRGKKTSEQAIATTVAYASAMGKTPIVVNDCPGFLVNRVLFPYFSGFMGLLRDGVDFQKIDKVMEKFGWPMGPAYLLDVVGLDTAFHADSVLASAFPDRMKANYKTALTFLFENKRFGQKNGIGFYRYVTDKKGYPKKEFDPSIVLLLSSAVNSKVSVTDDEIVERMMFPMLIESSRCLEEKIVSTPIEVDLGLVYGLGFPPFRGGILKYADGLGLKNICESSSKYSSLGKLYEPTEQMKKLAQNSLGFYSEFMK